MAATSKAKGIERSSEVVTFENINPVEMNKLIEAKVYLEDDTGSIIAGCFTPEADKWTPKTCTEVLDEAPNPDPYTVPESLGHLKTQGNFSGYILRQEVKRTSKSLW